MRDIEKIKAMKEGDTLYLHWPEYGGAQIHKYNYEYQLFEIPHQYAGTPRFVGLYKNAEEVVKECESWT